MENKVEKKGNGLLIFFILLVVCIWIVVGILFAKDILDKNVSTNTNKTTNNSNVQQNTKNVKKDIIAVLESNGYYIPNGYSNTYILPNEISEFGINSIGTFEFNFTNSTYALGVRMIENGNVTYERYSEYNWKLKTSQENYSQYSYTNGYKTLVDSAKAFVNSYGEFSCSGNTNACNDIKVSMEKHKNQFLEILSDANVSLNDLQNIK